MIVSLVDYGLGNLGSVANMFRRVGVETRRVATPEEIVSADGVLLPGIGAFDTGMQLLEERGLDQALKQFAASGGALLGICLGMQLLLDSSEEGARRGLGLMPGRSVRFPEDARIKVPHMGWNHVEPTRADPLVDGLAPDSRFYFVHSYRVVPAVQEDVLGVAEYGVEFAAMVRRDNVMGAQFHPEKSHAFGMQILSNFAEQ